MYVVCVPRTVMNWHACWAPGDNAREMAASARANAGLYT